MICYDYDVTIFFPCGQDTLCWFCFTWCVI